MTAFATSATTLTPFVPATPKPHRFSVAEYERMVFSGVLEEDLSIELIRGEIVDKMPTGQQHSWAIPTLMRLFVMQLGARCCYLSQSSLRLKDSLPEPDFVLLKPRGDEYALPPSASAADALLVIEVADTSIATDRKSKQELYAENGIPEYWIINLVDRTLEVYRQPQAKGYTEIRVLRDAETMAPLAFPDFVLTAQQLFPPQA